MKLLPTLIVLAALASLAGACAGADSDAVERIESESASIAQSAQRAQIIAALEPLDPLRYHHHDGTIRNEGRIPADAVIWATRARETLDWVEWPVELDAHVEQYADWVDSLLAAMRNDDAEAASEPSRITHALAHTFEATLEAWLSNDSLPAVPALAGLEPPKHEHEGHSDDHQDEMQHDDHSEDQMQHEGDDDDHGDHDEHE
ncbi:MAG: hypothetical protein OXH38_05340 [Chloroflexi bacterium]|nr:hypothetical protein [Chloroflexota bacterium]